MPSSRWLAGTALAALCVGMSPQAASAQRDTVQLLLRYAHGTKPPVLVLPILGVGGDSAGAIIQRDLDYDDRIQVMPLADTGIVSAGVNYALMQKLGAAAVVQAFLGPNSLHVVLHDVGNRRVMQTRDFALAPGVNSPEWRLAVHGASDEIVHWIVGSRGAAQSRIAFVRDGQIYITDSDGADTRPVTARGQDPLSPAWHPSGRYLTYSVFTPRGTQIAIQDLSANSVHLLTATPTGLNITPVFSPDGNQLAYAHGEESGTDLFLAPAFTAGPARRITVGHGTDNTNPVFGPTGNRIAFTSGRAGHPEVYITDVDGTDAQLLTPYEFGDDLYRSSPDWSPDDRIIAYESRVSGSFQIMTISLRDRSVKQLTSEGINEDPSWAPDSRHLVFTSNRSGVRELWVLDSESGRTRQLTRGGAARLAAWSRILATP